jgi:hypothetical protein
MASITLKGRQLTKVSGFVLEESYGTSAWLVRMIAAFVSLRTHATPSPSHRFPSATSILRHW